MPSLQMTGRKDPRAQQYECSAVRVLLPSLLSPPADRLVGLCFTSQTGRMEQTPKVGSSDQWAMVHAQRPLSITHGSWLRERQSKKGEGVRVTEHRPVGPALTSPSPTMLPTQMGKQTDFQAGPLQRWTWKSSPHSCQGNFPQERSTHCTLRSRKPSWRRRYLSQTLREGAGF